MWPYTDWMEQLYRLLKPGDPYFLQWVQFRRGLILQSFGAACLALAVFVLCMFVSLSFIPVEYAWYIAGSIGIAVGVLTYNWYGLRCPRCRRWYYDLFGERTANIQERCCRCGLQLYAPNGDL
jgi:hypothetical protein